jgi:hypothetical protein
MQEVHIMSAVHPSNVRTYSVLSSVVMVLCSPLLAMSYFATEDGAESYAVGSVHAWAEPMRRLLNPLLTFASADRVYATYSLLVAIVIPALPLAAWTVLRARAPLAGTFERRASRVVAAAWSLFSAALLVVALVLQVDPANVSGNSAVNVAFMAGMIPGLLIGCLGSAVLGVSLLRHGFVPRAAAVLILLAFPLWIVGSDVFGHNSIGLVPQVLAWTLALSAVGERTGVSPHVLLSPNTKD